MILYHVTQHIDHDGYFEPRIPDDRLEGEDDSTPRVCTSTTIEGCFSSMPGGGMGLENHIHDTHSIYKIYKIDTEKYKLRYMSSTELVCEELVMDAETTGEYWILDEFRMNPNDVFYIHLTYWQKKYEGYTSKKLIDILRKKEMTLNEFVRTDDFNDRLMSEVTLIYDLNYTSSLTGNPIRDLTSKYKIPLTDMLNLIPGVYAETKGFDVNIDFDEKVSVKEIYKLLGTIKGELTETNQGKIGEIIHLNGQGKSGKLLVVVDAYWMDSELVWAILLEDGTIIHEREGNFLKNIA